MKIQYKYLLIGLAFSLILVKIVQYITELKKLSIMLPTHNSIIDNAINEVIMTRVFTMLVFIAILIGLLILTNNIYKQDEIHKAKLAQFSESIDKLAKIISNRKEKSTQEECVESKLNGTAMSDDTLDPNLFEPKDKISPNVKTILYITAMNRPERKNFANDVDYHSAYATWVNSMSDMCRYNLEVINHIADNSPTPDKYSSEIDFNADYTRFYVDTTPNYQRYLLTASQVLMTKVDYSKR